MKAFIIRFIKKLDRDDMFGTAARTSFFVLLSLFPLVLFIIGVFGWFGLTPEGLEHILPAQLTGLLGTEAPPRAGETAVSLAVSLWSASRGIWALMRGVHTAYGGKRLKSGVGAQARALGLTLGFAVSLAVTAALWLLTGDWASGLFEMPSSGGVWGFIGSAAAVFLFVTLLYAITPKPAHMAPCIRARRIRALPGICLASAVWLAVNRAFGAYAGYLFADNPLYGGASAFLAVALWIYAVSAGIIAGAELNASACESHCVPGREGCADGSPPR